MSYHVFYNSEDEYLAHSLKGLARKFHKYLLRIKNSSGKGYRYFYSQAEIDAYMKKRKKKIITNLDKVPQKSDEPVSEQKSSGKLSDAEKKYKEESDNLEYWSNAMFNSKNPDNTTKKSYKYAQEETEKAKKELEAMRKEEQVAKQRVLDAEKKYKEESDNLEYWSNAMFNSKNPDNTTKKSYKYAQEETEKAKKELEEAKRVYSEY